MKKAERELAQSQRLFKEFLDNMPSLTYIKDPEGRYMLVNHTWCALTGIEESQAIGSQDVTLFGSEIAHKTGLTDNKAMLSMQPMVYEDNFALGGGDLRDYVQHKFAIRDANGDLMAMGGVAVDITSMKETQQALELSEERLNLAMFCSNAGMWDWHTDTNELVTNDIWASMLGFTLEELNEQFPLTVERWHQLVHPDDLNAVREALTLHMRGETESFQAEFRMRTKSGNWKWIMSSGKATERDGNGRAVRLLGIHLDIDGMKQLQSDLEEARDVAEKATLAKSLSSPT